MPYNPSAYGSFGGPSMVPSPSLYDLLGGVGGGSSQPGTPEEEQRKKQMQQQQQQGMAMGQQGLKMMQPQQMPVAGPPQMPQMQDGPNAAPPLQLPPHPQLALGQAPPPPPPPPRAPIGYDPRDPRSRNPIAGMPTPFGGVYR